MTVSKFMENFDVLGNKISFTIDGKKSMQTLIGTSLTFVFLILLGLVIYLNSVQLFKKENPISYEQTLITPDHPEVILDKSSFVFKFNYSDTNGKYIDILNYFEYDLSYYEFIYDDNQNFLILKNKTNIPLTNCRKKEVSESNNLCMPEDQSISLEGYWDQKILKFLRLNFYTCNSKINPNCHSIDKIFKYSADNIINVGFSFNRNTIKVSNFSYPINSNEFLTYKNLIKQQKITNFLIQTDTLNTDKGFLTEDIEKISFLNIEELQTDSAEFGEDSRLVYIACFYASNVSRNTQRSYIKIQDIFAKVGGIGNVIFFIFKNIINLISKIEMKLKIMNSIYCEEEVKKEFTSIGLESAIKGPQKINNNFVNPSGDRESKDTKINFLRKTECRDLELNFSISEIIKLIFSKNGSNKKFDQYFAFEKRINQYFDINTIIKKLEEFEILKFIIFNQNQLNDFNKIKPRLNVESDTKEYSKESNFNVITKTMMKKQ